MAFAAQVVQETKRLTDCPYIDPDDVAALGGDREVKPMPQGPTALDIFRRLKRTNCRECGLPSCMAFAAQVVQETKKLTDCPYLEPDDIAALGGETSEPEQEIDPEDLLAPLKEQVAAVDFAEAAGRLGGEAVGDLLLLHCLGREFALDKNGELHTLCHVNRWVHFPILSYVVHGRGADPTGDWVQFDDLDGALDWARFFRYRCRDTLHKLTDSNPDLARDVFGVFSTKPERSESGGGWSVVLRPLPKVAVRIRYWPAEGDLPSEFALHFDRSTGANLDIGATYTLSQGLNEMIHKIVQRHGG